MSGRKTQTGEEGISSLENMDAIMCCVRVRPFNEREIDMGCENIIEMPGGRHVVIADPHGGAHDA